jgi:hypothetical protein
MRRGLKGRLSKEENSSEETEKYKIRIPGGNEKKPRGTPNKQTKENIIESSNSKKGVEKDDSVRTASFTMEQEIEIKNKNNDDQTPSSRRGRRQINKTEEIIETKVENNENSSNKSKRTNKNNDNNEQNVEKIETVIETKTVVQESDNSPSNKYVRKRKYQRGNTPEIKNEEENKEETQSKKSNKLPKETKTEEVIETIETKIEKVENEPSNKYVRKRKYQRGNTPEIKKEDEPVTPKEETSSKYSKKSNKLPKEEKTEIVIETKIEKVDNTPGRMKRRKIEEETKKDEPETPKEETSSKYSKKSNRLPKETKTEEVIETVETKIEKVDNTPGRLKRRKIEESDTKKEEPVTPKEETSSKYSKKSNKPPKEEKTEQVIETVITKIEKVEKVPEKTQDEKIVENTPGKNSRRSKKENITSSEEKKETKKGITPENRYENSNKRDRTPPNDRSGDSNLDDSRTPTRLKEDIYKKEIGFEDETPNRSIRRQYNKQTNKSENSPEKYLKVTPGRYNRQTNDSKRVFDNEGNKTTSRIVGRMGKSPVNTPKVEEKEEKLKVPQKKTYQSTSTHIRLYGGDFDDIIRTIIHVELNDCRTILTPELLEIYKNIYFDNEDFKNEIFFKVLKNFDDEVGNFDKYKTPHTFNMDMENLQVLLDNIKTPGEMLNKYIEKAAQIDNNTSSYNN